MTTDRTAQPRTGDPVYRALTVSMRSAVKTATAHYFAETASAARTPDGMARYVTDELVETWLPKLGYWPVVASDRWPNMQFAVRVPDDGRILPARDYAYAQEVVDRSSPGAEVVWRFEGQWFDGPPPT